jgi:hypothetical protein
MEQSSKNRNALMDAFVTGITAGIENNTIANKAHITAMELITVPHFPRGNGALSISFRPLKTLIATGIA